MHVLGKLNLEADMLSRSNVPSDKWTLHRKTWEIWGIFDRPEVNLFDSEDNTHCQTYFLKDMDALVHDWPNLILYSFSHGCPDPAGNQANQGTEAQS